MNKLSSYPRWQLAVLVVLLLVPIAAQRLLRARPVQENDEGGWAAHPSPILCVAATADGKLAVSGAERMHDDPTMTVWDLADETPIFSCQKAGVCAVAFIRDGRYVLSGGRDKLLRIWDVKAKEEVATLDGHANRINAIAASADGTRAISAGFDSEARVWDLADPQSPKLLRTVPAGELGATAVAISPDGKRALVGGCKSIDLWNLDTGEKLGQLPGHTSWVFSVAFSSDGTRALSGGYDKTVRVWDLRGQKGPREEQVLLGHTDTVRSVTFAGNDRRAVSAGDDHIIRVWDLATGRQIAALSGHGWVVTQVAAFEQGHRAISCDWLGRIRLWDLP